MKQGLLRPTSDETAPRRAFESRALWLGAVLAVGTLVTSGCQDPNSGGAPTRHAKKGHGGGGHGEVETLPSIPKRPAGVSVAAVLEKAKKHFSPLPDEAESRRNPATEEKIALGRMLYADKRLSKAGDIACATCHDLAGYGIDIREDKGQRARTSLGHQGQRGDRNSPSVYNAGLYVAQFWDGRAKDLEEQAKGPVLNPVEMAMPDEAAVVDTIKGVPGYVEAFANAFPGQPDPITYDNMAKAIGAFERQLMTPGPFDEFLDGKITALDEQQLQGLQLFIDSDCVKCHTGPAVGGTKFEKLGTVKPWEGLEESPDFKVPSLRNITETAPYLHDGSIDSLDTMVQKMAEHQLARGPFEPDDLAAVLAFLGSLKGELPTQYIAAPTLPASAPKAPEPEPIVEGAPAPADGAAPAPADGAAPAEPSDPA